MYKNLKSKREKNVTSIVLNIKYKIELMENLGICFVQGYS